MAESEQLRSSSDKESDIAHPLSKKRHFTHDIPTISSPSTVVVQLGRDSTRRRQSPKRPILTPIRNVSVTCPSLEMSDDRTRRKQLHDFRIHGIEKLIFHDDDNPTLPSENSAQCTDPGPYLRDHHLEKTELSSASSMRGRHKRVVCRCCKQKTFYVCSGCPADTYGKRGLCPECLHKYDHL